MLIGNQRTWAPLNPIQGTYWTHSYPTRGLLPMMGPVKLTRSLDLSQTQTPVLVIYSPADRVVDPVRIENTFKKFGSKQKQLTPYTGSQDPNQHVPAGDILSKHSTEKLEAMIIAFIRRTNR